jgi:hypothetical protein
MVRMSQRLDVLSAWLSSPSASAVNDHFSIISSYPCGET